MLSPLDSRYKEKVKELLNFFGETEELKIKTQVELLYFQKLCIALGKYLSEGDDRLINDIYHNVEIERIKFYEEQTKHDIKAIEYYVKSKFKNYVIPHEELIHFGLTSQDINSVCTSLQLTRYNTYFLSFLSHFIDNVKKFGEENDCLFPARTHGQLAVPTSFQKEIDVFVTRLKREQEKIHNYNFFCKFGGAVGNLSAHYIAYPDIDWNKFANNFVESLGLSRTQITTQVDDNASISEYFDIIRRINNILIDFCRDMWMYFSYSYFTHKPTPEEVGSSTMPQKINPINFENAEGNLELANCILAFMSNKLQISRMQRDLSDTTVVRNIGVPLGHSFVAYKSIITGLERATINKETIVRDLVPQMLSEAQQTILRKENVKGAYELIKNIVRDGKMSIDDLEVSDSIKNKLKNISFTDYLLGLRTFKISTGDRDKK